MLSRIKLRAGSPRPVAAASRPPASARPPFRDQRSRGKPARATPDANTDLDARQWVGGGFDPEGLFSSPAGSSGGHFARRKEGKSLLSPQAAPAPAPLQPVDLSRHPDGISPADEGFDREAFVALLAARYMPVDLTAPGLRVLHLDPPVITVDDCFSPEQCEAMMAAAVASDAWTPSAVGDATVGSGGNEVSQRRTSSTMLLDAPLQARHTGLRAAVKDVHAAVQRLLPEGAWSAQGKLPPPGSFCNELLQVARYTPGQHFLAHEDAFPADTAASNKFQRRATVIAYLNDVSEGGCTHFETLGVRVQPRQGRVCVFFPADAQGVADARTLHTAEDAVDEKWIAQQWVAWGMPDEQLPGELRGLLGGAATPAGGGGPGLIERRMAARKAADDASNSVPAELLVAKRKGTKGRKKKSKGKRAGFGG